MSRLPCAVVLAWLLCVPSARALAAPPPGVAGIRPLDQFACAVLREGLLRSPTIRAQAAAIATSDLIVYLRSDWRRLSGDNGYLTFLTAAPEVRFVQIHFSVPSMPDEAIEILGHELQHAIEVAQAPWVRDSAAFGRLYLQIGYAVDPSQHLWETAEARHAGLRVRQELRLQHRGAIGTVARASHREPPMDR
jgi:hypothetical protein